MKFFCCILTLAAVLDLSNVCTATTLYSEDFNVDDTANWVTNAGPSDYVVDYFYDYSAIGVPAAPSGIGTRGLKMAANVTSNIFGGFTVSPVGQSFSGDYSLTFDMWQNYVGPLGPGGSGTTQFTQYGIGTSGNSSQWIGATSKDSVSFGTTLDGGSASDFRAYSSAAITSYPAGSAVYQAPAGAINNSASYYMAAYPAVSAPATQQGLFAGQSGSTDAGETAFAWRKVRIDVAGGFASWSIDGTPLARVNLSTVALGGGNILFGHSDTNASSSTDPNSADLNVTLIDNIRVDSTAITYQGVLANGVSQFDSVSSSGGYSDPASARFWTFFGNQGDTVTIEGLRDESDLDPAMWVYEGVFTDTSQFDGGFGPGFDGNDPGFLAFADDEIPNPGPFGDPRAVVTLTLPGTGQYTVALTNYDSGPNDGGDGRFNYHITLNPVPESASIVLVSIASSLIGLGSCRRRNRFLRR